MAPKTKTPPPRIQIQDVWPILDCGRYPPKRSLGDPVEVWATIFKDGHDVLAASVRYRPAAERRWRGAPMHPPGDHPRVGPVPGHPGGGPPYTTAARSGPR